MMNKLFSILGIVFLSTLPLVSSAAAQDIPQLNWERGRLQEITLGGNTAQGPWTLKLEGSNTSLVFDPSSSSKAGFLVYSLGIPKDLTIGNYQIITSNSDGQSQIVAYVKILNLISYEPKNDPEGISILVVLVITLLSLISGNRSAFDSGKESEEEDSSSIGSVDTNYHGIQTSKRGRGDERRIGKSKIVQKLDQIRHFWIFSLSSRSPMLTRIVADGTYLQSLVGIFSLALPITGFVLGVKTADSTDLAISLVPTSVVLAISIMSIGIFDSLAGFVAVIAYGIFTIVVGGIDSVSDVRTLLGLSLLWFTPILIAGAIRPLRRAKSDWDLWERITDIVVSTLISGWAIKGIVLALDGFAHEKTVLAPHADEIALIGAGLIMVRYLLEEFTSRYTPERLEYLTPPKLMSQDFDKFLITLLVRTLIFIFFMAGFFGVSWHIFAATTILILPSFFKRFDSKLPNFSWLWQVIPGGIPLMVVMSLIGIGFSKFVDSLPLLSPDKSKTILILTSLPGLVLSFVRLFARQPRAGDVRWYRRSQYSMLYKAGGPVMLVVAMLISIGVIQ